MQEKSIDSIYEKSMICGVFSLIWLPLMLIPIYCIKKRSVAVVMVLVHMVVQIKSISRIFKDYKPARTCPICDLGIPEGSNFCPFCGYILRKDLWMSEVPEDEEEWLPKSSSEEIEERYKKIEEEAVEQFKMI